MSLSADPITQTGEFYPGDIDATMAAIAQSIIDADATLPEFTAANVIVTDPEETAEDIDKKVKAAIAKAKGVALLVVASEDAENAEPDAATPRPRITFELQLFLARRRVRRPAGSRTPLVLRAALAKHLHSREIRIQGMPFWDRIVWRSWAPLEDADYQAWSITFDREIQL